MEFKSINRRTIEWFLEIDRSEIIDFVYYFKNGKLELEKEHWDVPGWNSLEFPKLLDLLYLVYDRGGFFWGAFENNKLIGSSVLDCKFIGSSFDQLQLVFLHVSKPYRKKGIGKTLLNLAIQKAKNLGAKKLYISATPSRNTVEFYLNQGCLLVNEINKELFEKESEDIHLELPIWDLIEDTKEINKQTKEEIAEARLEINEGKFHTLSQVKKELRL